MADGWCASHPTVRTSTNPRTGRPYTRCDACNLAASERYRAKLARRRARGLCRRCGRKAVRIDGVTGSECARHRRARQIAEQARRAQGVCTRDGCGLPCAPGVRMCRAHREEVRQYGLRLYDDRRRAGICPICGDRPLVIKGARVLSACRPCLDIVAARMARRREARP